jgi:uncharacterized SAM-binding protein YcdF (DUF218 family)
VAFRLFRLRYLLCAAAVLVLLFLARSWWLPLVGYALIHDDGPAKADIAVVLAGDFYGHRIVKAGELVRDGYVPLVLVSGPEGIYGVHESDLAIPLAVRHGFPAEWFAAFPNQAHSTLEEAEVILPELRRRNVKSFLLVTTDFHTARARRIYLKVERDQGGGPQFRTVAAPDEFFRPDSWWHNRQAEKTVFFEWSKSVAGLFGY